MSSIPKTRVTVSAVQALILQDGLLEAMQKRYAKFYRGFQDGWARDSAAYIEAAAKRRLFRLLPGRVVTQEDLNEAFLPSGLATLAPTDFGPKWWYRGWRFFWDSLSFPLTRECFKAIPNQETWEEVELFARSKFVDESSNEQMESITFDFYVYRLIICLQEDKYQ